MVAVLVVAGFILSQRGPDPQRSDQKRDLVDQAPSAPSTNSAEELPAPVAGDPSSRIVTTPPSVLTRAAEFPHQLKIFQDWQRIDAAQMTGYRRSLISRVGRWAPAEISRFYLAADQKITDPEARTVFQRAVLGSWCAKDVEHCLAALEENLSVVAAPLAKRNALAGWARQDWLAALRYLNRHGDQRIEQRLGGDSAEYAQFLVAAVMAEHGAEEARGVLAQMTTARNQQAGAAGLAGANNSEPQTLR